ncbi:hypothetical protein [Ferruginibacter sp.]
MKKTVTIIMAAAFFAACKKNNTDVQPVATSAVPKVKTLNDGSAVATFAYTADGNLQNYSIPDGSKVECEYLPGIINKKVYTTGGVFNYAYKFELNAAGLVIRTTLSNAPDYEVLDQYNPDNTHAKSVSKINGITNTADYFYSNGNCDSIRYRGNDGTWYSTIVKTYYTDKPNVLTQESTGEKIYGKDNKNLLKTEMYKYPNGTSTQVVVYTYDYDAQGRITKETGTQGATVFSMSYTYY